MYTPAPGKVNKAYYKSFDRASVAEPCCGVTTEHLLLSKGSIVATPLQVKQEVAEVQVAQLQGH